MIQLTLTWEEAKERFRPLSCLANLLLGGEIIFKSIADLYGTCGFGKMTEEAVSFIYGLVYK